MASLKTSDFDYILPEELIAQTPLEPRDHSRLLVANRTDGSLSHRRFYELSEYLKAGDVLVFNNSRVIRARLFGIRKDTGRKIEILLLRRIGPNTWESLIGSKKRVTSGLQIEIEGDTGIKAEVLELKEAGIRVVRFSNESSLPQIGHVPLPPYIHEPLSDPERYQTVYAKKDGSVAAPTAGLHFTPELLKKIEAKGIRCVFVTLHVGLNTFRPVQVEDVLKHPIFPEYGVISETAAEQINLAKSEGRRVICVGTTSVRLVESAAHHPTFASEAISSPDPLLTGEKHSQRPISASSSDTFPSVIASSLDTRSNLNPNGPIQPWDGWVHDFIYPGYQFKIMDAMVTNFHLPKSTLLMLVSAFAGQEFLFKAYREAISQKYRFYSFGDAMLII